MSHTPGPWFVDGIAGTESLYVITSDGEDIARVRGGDKHVDANANLISAAPELYDALKKLMGATVRADNPSDMGVSHDAPEMIAARAALAKAEGK